jgi:hypothetical protein
VRLIADVGLNSGFDRLKKKNNMTVTDTKIIAGTNRRVLHRYRRSKVPEITRNDS